MNIHVGNLFRDLAESDLREAFASFEEVRSAAIIKDKFSGESRGFGFVEMPNKDEAEKAITTLNCKDLKGRTATVNEARPRTNKPRTGFGGGKRFSLSFDERRFAPGHGPLARVLKSIRAQGGRPGVVVRPFLFPGGIS